MIIPSKDREEWKALLTGELDAPLKNFFFQMKVTQARTQIQKGIVSVDSAINELYVLCRKFSKARNMFEDMKSIFGENFMNEQNEVEEIKKESFQTNILAEESTDTVQSIADNQKNLLANLRVERELLFYKKTLEEKEKDIQEKNKLIITLQEDVIFLRKKNIYLYEVIEKIEEIKGEESKKEKEVVILEEPQEEQSGWSFFNIFKKSK